MLKNFFSLLIFFFTAVSCAKVTMLEGGPKDDIPPKVISQKPANETCGISTKKKLVINLKFDKNIYVKNPDQIVITPKLTEKNNNKKSFDCFNDDNSISLVIYQGLEPDTTYSINFNNTVIGYRDDKPISNLMVTFSTGESVHKNILSGQVINLMTLKNLNNGIVCLYDFDKYDEVEIKGKKQKVHANIISSKEPQYFTKTDEKGNFTFTNPKPGKYLCCAGDNKDEKLFCDPNEDNYGFKIVEVKKDSTVKTVINIGKASINDLKIISSQNKGRCFEVKFNKTIKHYSIKADINSEFYKKLHIYSQLLEDGKTIRIFNYGLHMIYGDNLRLKILVHDEVGNKLEEHINLNFSEGQKLDSNFKIFISNENLRRNCINGLKFKIATSLPLLNFDSKKIFLLINEKFPLELTEKDFRLGYHRNEIFINKKFNLQEFLSENDPSYNISQTSIDDFSINVIVKDDALKSVLKSTNKEVKKKFIYSAKHGTLAGKVMTKNKFRIQLLNDQLELVAESKNKNFAFRDLAPGKYILRGLYFKGNDWSCGNIFELKEADKIVYSEIIEVLPNWKKEDIFLTDISLF